MLLTIRLFDEGETYVSSKKIRLHVSVPTYALCNKVSPLAGMWFWEYLGKSLSRGTKFII